MCVWHAALILRESSSYLRSGWNRLDGFVVMVSLLGIVFPSIRVFRSFRALRPLRLLVRSKHMQVRRGSDTGTHTHAHTYATHRRTLTHSLTHSYTHTLTHRLIKG